MLHKVSNIIVGSKYILYINITNYSDTDVAAFIIQSFVYIKQQKFPVAPTVTATGEGRDNASAWHGECMSSRNNSLSSPWSNDREVVPHRMRDDGYTRQKNRTVPQ